jgi:hypothetical protein
MLRVNECPFAVKLQRGIRVCRLSPVWAVRIERPKRLKFNGFCNCQRIFKFDPQLTISAVHLRMSQQQLNGTQAARQ